MPGSAEAAPARVRRGLEIVPRPLAALILATALLGLMWALLVPPWQSPDEPQHFAYAESLAQRFALPGDKHRAAFSTAQGLADSSVGAGREAFYPAAVQPDWSSADYSRYKSEIRATSPSASNGGGPNSAAVNPPLYYLYADLAYWVSGGNSFDHLYAMQIWNVLLLVITVTAAWLLAGEVLGRRRVPQLACAAVAGLLPIESFIATSVNPDSLMVALWALALWLGARVICRGGRRRDMVALGLVTAGAVLTKATSYALVPAALLAILLAYQRCAKPRRRALRRNVGLGLAALAVPILAWLALATALGRSAVNTIQPGPHPHPFNISQFLSYVWQFYLPRLPSMTLFRETPGLPVYDLWVKEGLGVFGWLDIGMPEWVYKVFAVAMAMIGVGGVALICRFRDRVRLELLAFFALGLVALLAGLHLTDYRAIIAGEPAVIQGRYLLPVLPLLGLTVGMIVTRLRASWRAPATGALIGVLLVLQVLALATIGKAYYT
jgi:4-amino-4-deoxy-L-arabinose transferase-like glycosyltransferase